MWFKTTVSYLTLLFSQTQVHFSICCSDGFLVSLVPWWYKARHRVLAVLSFFLL